MYRSIILIVIIFILAGLLVFSYSGRAPLQSEIEDQATQVAGLEATLVNVFTDERESRSTATAAIEARDREIAQLAATAEAAGDLTLSNQSEEVEGTPDPFAVQDRDAPPQIRIRLRETDTIRTVGNPIDIIASAAHPLGIAVLNLTVNGETLYAESPADPRMDIVTVRWVPESAGTYNIEAIGTTVRGRASNPVSISVEVIESDDTESVLQATLRQIEAGVRDLRGLDEIGPVSINVIDRLELQESIRVELLGDFTPEDAAQRVHVLSAFDFVSPDYPLYDSMVETLGFGVAGYYDDERDALFVVDDDGELEKEERLTHAHEYMHALQDQHYGLGALGDGTLNADEALAFRSLAEGETTLIETLFDARGYLTGEQNADSNPVFPTPASERSPSFLVNELAFPYVRGYEFVSYFFEGDSFGTIEALWNERPLSSEQIIHPEKYAAGDLPIVVGLPDLLPMLGEGWTLVEENVFGEFYFVQYLSLWLDSDTADSASAGWGGDRFAVYLNPETGEKVMVLRSMWDAPAEQDEFVAAYQDWVDAQPYQTVSLADLSLNSESNLSCWEKIDHTLCLFLSDDEVTILRANRADLIGQVFEALR